MRKFGLKEAFAADPDLGEDLLDTLFASAATPINAGEYANELRRLRQLRDLDWLADDIRTFVRQHEHGKGPGQYVARKLAELPGDSADSRTIPYTLFAATRPVITGVAWRGRKTTRAGVLYLAPDGGSVVGNRIEAYRRHHAVADADFFVVSTPVDLLGKVTAGDSAKVEGGCLYKDQPQTWYNDGFSF